MAVEATRLPGLAGRVAVVTGASSGIGRAIALLLSAQGTAVAVSGRRVEALEALAETIRHAGGRCAPIGADVTRPEDLLRLRGETERLLGPVDLVAAAAGGLGEPVPLLELSLDRWRQVIDLNLTAAFLTMQAFLPGMAARRRGAMVSVSSTAGRAASIGGGTGQRASAAYAAAKTALQSLTHQAAAEVAAQGVRVNAVAPGAIRSGGLARAPEDVLSRVGGLHPLGRIGEPEDVAAAAAFLLSDSSSWVTGATIDVNGGRIMI